MKQVLSALALTIAFTSISLGQAVQKHEMTDSKKAEMSLYPAAEIQWWRYVSIRSQTKRYLDDLPGP